MSYDKEEVKQELMLEDIAYLLEELGAQPEVYSNYIIAKTICHNGDGHKLYYYDNTQLFKCYTGVCGTFDVFELIQNIKDIDLNTAIYYIVNFFNIQGKVSEVNEQDISEDWKILKRYNKLLDIEVNNGKIELPILDSMLLNNYPQPRYKNWEEEYISKEICDFMNIRYDPVNGNILIPHYDENNNMIGVRGRTLIKENEENGKYRPVYIQGKLRNHPLAFNLYGLNKAKKNIKNIGVAMVFESEKAVLQSMSYLGVENNVAVAMCGSSLSRYQFQLLLDSGVQEIVIGLDKDFHKLGDDEYYQTIKKIQKLCDKYSHYCRLSFMFDKWNMLNYKDSPTDEGKDIFMYLWRNRVVI